MQPMVDPLGFDVYRPQPGVHLAVCANERFRLATFAAFVEQRLDEDLAAATALLPEVLGRGTKTYPQTLDLERAQAELYGATINTGVIKLGERHLIAVWLSMPGQRFVDAPDLYRRGMQLLTEVLAHPARARNGSLRGDYVRQEADQLTRRIRSLADNKSAYARWRCIRAMCAGEPYGVFELGSEEKVQAISPGELAAYHRDLLSGHPISLYALGPFAAEAEAIAEQLAQSINWSRRNDVPDWLELPASTHDRPTGSAEPRRVEERQAMTGGWLVLGYRTPIVRSHPAYPAMLFLNAMFGGTVHSRLFLNVREKASLAYAASSSYDAHKGIVMAVAGIDPQRRADAERMIAAQLDDLRNGNISDEEMAATRATLISRLKEREDKPADRILANLAGRLGGRLVALSDELADVAKVTKADVAAAARQLQLDTAYFLGGATNVANP